MIIQIELTDEEFKRLRLPSSQEKIQYRDFKRYFALSEWKDALVDTQQAALESGLNEMTLAETNAEIQAARQNHD